MKIILLTITVLCSLFASANKSVTPPPFLVPINLENSNEYVSIIDQTKLPCTKTTTLVGADFVNCDDGSTVSFFYSGFGTATDNSCSVANALSESRAYADLEIKRTQQAAAARTRCPLTPH